MISVVIPLYNKEKLIANTLQTVFDQTFRDFEIVIVNDGSTDGSADVVRGIDDPRIRLIEQSNGGVSAARNRGVAESRGEYIAFLDADDEWKPDYLATQYALAEKYPQCSVFAVNYEFRDTQGKTTPTIIRKLPFNEEDGVLTNYFEVASCSHPPICSISIMVRKNAIESIGGFQVGIKSGEDLITWARLAVKYDIAYSKVPYAIYVVPAKKNRVGCRRMENIDVVGPELKEIYDLNKDVRGLKTYISHWHKMRASVAMRHGEIIETISEAVLSIKYNMRNYKVLLYVLVSMSPKKIRAKVISLEK